MKVLYGATLNYVTIEGVNKLHDEGFSVVLDEGNRVLIEEEMDSANSSQI